MGLNYALTLRFEAKPLPLLKEWEMIFDWHLQNMAFLSYLTLENAETGNC